MILSGAIVNSLSVAVGSVLGVVLQKRISAELNLLLTQGLGVCVALVGIKGALGGENIVISILAIVLGGIIGHWIDFDARLIRAGESLQGRMPAGSQSAGFSAGFVNCTLFVCVGAMAIVGSLESGLSGNNEILYAKATIDFVAALVFAATLGLGAALAAIPVFLYEAALTLSSHAAGGGLSAAAIQEMAAVGGILILMIGLNMLKITRIKVANFLPAPFLPALLLAACNLAVKVF